MACNFLATEAPPAGRRTCPDELQVFELSTLGVRLSVGSGLREAYRTQKGLLPAGVDVMLVYNTKEVLSFEEIHALVGRARLDIAGHIVTEPASQEKEEKQ